MNDASVYRPTQRCPNCHSDDTTMKVVDAPEGAAHVIDAKWTCRTCRNVFKPSNAHISTPILFCGSCVAPHPHTFAHNEGDFAIYTCSACGQLRRYGCAEYASLAVA